MVPKSVSVVTRIRPSRLRHDLIAGSTLHAESPNVGHVVPVNGQPLDEPILEGSVEQELHTG